MKSKNALLFFPVLFFSLGNMAECKLPAYSDKHFIEKTLEGIKITSTVTHIDGHESSVSHESSVTVEENDFKEKLLDLGITKEQLTAMLGQDITFQCLSNEEAIEESGLDMPLTKEEIELICKGYLQSIGVKKIQPASH